MCVCVWVGEGVCGCVGWGVVGGGVCVCVWVGVGGCVGGCVGCGGVVCGGVGGVCVWVFFLVFNISTD